ncbi:glycosyltransferase family 2 protein [Maricaulis sp.]|uniref:glycosyltransferase family 2 protein n=1 Tax=Maricaulis sp. TaxID=1486257 RepID=UPI0025BBA067|nr:glycosyltransferase family 2 protein [Maricaulis sp.]
MGLQSQASAGPGTVTIITATHNRPDALRLAISSVRNQTHANWRLLVVGDHCDPRTGAVIAAFGDPRIHYVNLPHRCGEQSGPNSVGMALARTPFTAFLNHDDLWFPDHLETGLGRLDEEKADFFAGRAAFLETGAAETDDLVISDVTPDDRSLAGAFVHTPAYFEPVSTWILRSEACRRVGPWRASTELYRTPLEDWVLRAWRTGLKLVGEERVSVIKPRLLARLAADVKAYDRHPPGLDRIADDITRAPDQVRSGIASWLLERSVDGQPGGFDYRADGGELHARAARMLTPASAEDFHRTGQDVMDRVCRDSGQARGHVLRWALGRRTGEELPERPALTILLEAARAQLQADFGDA